MCKNFTEALLKAFEISLLPAMGQYWFLSFAFITDNLLNFSH